MCVCNLYLQEIHSKKKRKKEKNKKRKNYEGQLSKESEQAGCTKQFYPHSLSIRPALYT